MNNKTIAQVTEKCTACGLCLTVCPKACIQMRTDSAGFAYPVIQEELCIKCGKCLSNCPQYTQKVPMRAPIAAYAAWNQDKKQLMAATSGGVFISLAKSILEQGGYVVGAVYDASMNVHHILSDSYDEILRMRQSKYVQSDFTEMLPAIADVIETHPVLVTGTPCQIDAVRRKFGDHPHLYLMQLLCHGVPSPGIFRQYIGWLEKKYHAKIVDFRFRDKKNGWQKMTQCAVFENGKTKYWRAYENHFQYWFGKHYSVRTSCFDCSYRQSTYVGDLVIGDFWNGIRKYPELDYQNGVGVLLVTSEKGKTLLKQASGVTTKQIDVQDAINPNSLAFQQPKLPDQRELYLKTFCAYDIEQLTKKFAPESKISLFVRQILKR